MKFPKGTKFQAWSLHSEKQKGTLRAVIRRWGRLPTGEYKMERLKTDQYAHLRDHPLELKKYVIRLNQQIKPEERTKAKVEIKHAFISPDLLDDYKDFLITQIPTKSRALVEHQYLIKYFLHFFIGALDISDPLEWHRRQKTEWAKFLLSEKAPAAATTKKEIVAAANRFMEWLHERRPNEVPPLKFKPLTTAIYKKVEAEREMNGETHHPRAIKLPDWESISKHLPATIAPFVNLAYHYGLRRSETLGVKPGDTKKTYLSVERQLVALNQYEPLKGREARKVPHWFSEARNVYSWIDEAQTLLLHPDTLTDRWNVLMEGLKLTYTFHDLRHSFITRAISAHPPRDVQLAAGHKNIETTMRYSHDNRNLDNEEFMPETG